VGATDGRRRIGGRPRWRVGVGALVVLTAGLALAAALRRPPPARALALGTVELRTGPLKEVSGCAVDRRNPDVLWLHNDSGDEPLLFALEPKTGEVRAVRVTGAPSTDWEDIAAYANGDLLIADIGDNLRRRTAVSLIRVPRPGAKATRIAARRVQRLRYDDGPHDAEAVLIDPTDERRVYVVTKERDGRSGVFLADGDVLRRVATIRDLGEAVFLPGQVSAADALPDGRGLVLRTYQGIYLLERPTPGAPFADAFTAPSRRLRVEGAMIGQYEALCITPDGSRLVTVPESRGSAWIRVTVAALP
jgi:hypothetical protein